MPRAFDMDLEQCWRERFREFKRSGLSVREYCRSHALREHTFFWWRRALAKRDRLRQAARLPRPQSAQCRRTPHAAQSRRADASTKQPRRTPAFVPVLLVSEPICASCIEIRLGACLLRVPTTIGEQPLRQAIRIIREEAAGC